MARPTAALVLAALICLAGPSCAGDATQHASLRVALTAETCADYCAVTLLASIVREDDSAPIGPPTQVGCGEEVVFGSLPAGHRVFVRMSLLDIAGATLLSGVSDVVTVVADDLVDVPVLLTAEAPPEIVTLSPDPLSVSSGPSALTLTGAGFDPAEGAWGVELDDGTALDVTDWSDATIAATLSPGLLGTSVRVRRCGVASAPASIRVLARDAPGAQVIAQSPGCDGRRYVAAARDAEADGAWVAADCDVASNGYLLRVERDGDGCVWETGAAWTVGHNPVDVAARDDHAWVALDTGDVTRVTIATGALAAATLPADTSVRRVAAPAAGSVFAIGEGPGGDALFEAPDGLTFAAVSSLAPGPEYAGLAASDAAVFATAREAALGKLVRLLVGSDIPAEWTLTGCAAPGAVAATPEGALLAVACEDEGDGAIALFAPADPPQLARVPLGADARVTAVAFDEAGDVVFAWDTGQAEVVVVKYEATGEAVILERWPIALPAAPPVLATVGPRLLLASHGDGDALAVWTPYHELGPCAEAGQ